MSMARFDTDSAFLCYSDRTEVSSNDQSMNRCRVLAITGDQVQVRNSVNFGARTGGAADPCVVSRLTVNQGIACCEKPSWVPFRNWVECKVLFADSSNQLSLNGGQEFHENSLDLHSHFGRMHVQTMVHLRDSSSESLGEVEVCYQPNDDTRLTCDTLQVKESWSWYYWRNIRKLEIKNSARYEFYNLAGRDSHLNIPYGRFFSLTRSQENN